MDDQDKVSQAAIELGRRGGLKGGRARAEKLTSEERSEIARRAVQARWAKVKGVQSLDDIPTATHTGVVKIGDIELPCAVLEDGTRVFTQGGFLNALGRSERPAGQRGEVFEQLPAFLVAKNLKPFISEELVESSRPILFRTTPSDSGRGDDAIGRGGIAYGYKVELLPQVCRVYLDARDAGVLMPGEQHGQKRIAARCDMLVRGLATVGIIALVDEATGYQNVRDRQALQAILDKYLRKEFAAWAQVFPDEFYKEIFRLRNWQWRGMKVNRPQCVANYTKDLVYARLAPGILKELEERNPKDAKGNRRAKHHQWLTEDVGHPALAQHLYAIIGFMRSSDTWDEMVNRVDRAFPKRGDTLQLPLFKDEDFS